MAKPLIPVESIYDHALALLDAEGTAALSTRRLATELRISTRTLYQQVGNREQLIRALVARHFSLLRLDFHEYEDWESTALQWCLSLHDALRAHPYLTELMTIDDRNAVMDYVHDLVDATRREGFPFRLAVECCRALANLTINHTIVEVRGLREPKLSEESAARVDKTEKNFAMSIRWLLAGVRAEAQSNSSESTDTTLVARPPKRRDKAVR
ncbi:TetR family transcriptional regulator [Nocardia pseudovaccinii]|uniref:TetR family transcriptional regulator n=1 Tax=Nocardia pseudovaccinii TaxID=189540 RepID=UPI003D92629E